MIEAKKREPTKLLDSIAHKVIGAAIQVHCALGPGFLERLYERALCLEMHRLNLKFACQVPIKVKYKSVVIGEMRLDLVVEDQLVVELKAVEALSLFHSAQLISYLKSSGYHLGLLVNFNVPILKQGIKRVIVS